jgi:hypothetical protein
MLGTQDGRGLDFSENSFSAKRCRVCRRGVHPGSGLVAGAQVFPPLSLEVSVPPETLRFACLQVTLSLWTRKRYEQHDLDAGSVLLLGNLECFKHLPGQESRLALEDL